MVYLDPTLNIVTKTLRVIGKTLVREFNEIETLQSSIKGTTGFADKTLTKIKKNLVSSLNEIKPNYKVIFYNSSFTHTTNESGVWHLDPLNGYDNFSHGIPHFCITLAIIEKLKVISSAVYDPIKDEMFYASLGKGSYINDTRIRVSSRSKIDECIMSIDLENNDENISSLKQNLESQIQITRKSGCTSLDMCYLACGRFDNFIKNKTEISKLTAECLILKEAGAIVKPVKNLTNTIIASNTASYSSIEKIINKT